MPSTQVPPASVLKHLLEFNVAALVETLFYGIHFVLFCICMFILIRNRQLTHWFILVSAFVMFALSTADISITIRMVSYDIVPIFDQDGSISVNAFLSLLNRLCYQKILIFVTNNLIAELILLYRCYMVLGRSKYLLISASLLVLGDTVWGYLSAGPELSFYRLKFTPVYLWSVFAINIVITGIAAGRIFWVSQIARPILGHRNFRHFHIVIAVLLESSAVYSVCLLLHLVLPPGTLEWLVTTLIGTRAVAIMPTLLIVQIGLLADRSDLSSGANDYEQPAATSTVVLDTVVATMHENQ